MTVDRLLIFDAAKQLGAKFASAADVALMDQAIDQALGVVREPAPASPIASASKGPLTLRGAQEIAEHEAIVPELYRDSVGIWTWGIGVTNASGHLVYPRYKDNPQPIERCIELFIWLLETKYIPDVLKAFEGCPLTEAQFTAALSFHYNTGAIGRAQWVKDWKAGRKDAARSAFMNWTKPPEITARRQKECDLFFDGKWSQDGKALVYSVRKPSYKPTKPKSVDISAALRKLVK